MLKQPYLETLDINTLHDILILLPLSELFELCKTNVRLSQICSSNRFWARRANYDFNTPPAQFNQLPLSGYRRYLLLKPQKLSQKELQDIYDYARTIDNHKYSYLANTLVRHLSIMKFRPIQIKDLYNEHISHILESMHKKYH